MPLVTVAQEVALARRIERHDVADKRRYLICLNSAVRRTLWAMVAAAVLLGALATTRLLWPQVRLGNSDAALAKLDLPAFAGHIEAVRVGSSQGSALPVALRDGELWPLLKVRADQRLTVSVTVRRPSWAAWLVGRTERRTFTVVTPDEQLGQRWLHVSSGSTVTISFDAPVAEVSLDASVTSLARPRRVVSIGIVARGVRAAGSVTVAAAARSWERLSAPVRVSWFTLERGAQVVTAPSRSTMLSPTSSLTVIFSEPVAEVLGSARPTLTPATAGRWRLIDAHTLTFQPKGFGFAFGERVQVTLPAAAHLAGQAGSAATQTLTWRVSQGSVLRAQQLLAELGYLPLHWRTRATVPHTLASQLAAAVSPPSGTFSWRYPALRGRLAPLWRAGRYGVVLRGAIMAFEADHGLASDGVLGSRAWHVLVRAALFGEGDRHPYDYISVSTATPETLRVWRNGRVVYSSPCNTGIASRPTALGTYPVYARYLSTTMSGTNPDGSHYNDSGVPWVAYFNGGDAVHGFLRPGYGYPQSLGCVELPYSAAQAVYPYDLIGTLVAIS